MSKFVCNYPWTHFEVNNPNGDVTMCCDNSTVLGNINDQSITEIWNGSKYREMRKRMCSGGAQGLCPSTCPVIHGFKTHQNLDWYTDLPTKSQARINAELNEKEFAEGQDHLKSLPRWMRFTYSYKCNLDCYHCYQREDATQNVTLPDDFLRQVYELVPNYQAIFYFGGEPFLYKPVTKMMEEIELDPGCRFFVVTNATLLTEKSFSMLESKNLGMIAVSLDAADSETFNDLRVRGRKASWDTVMENIGRLSELHQRKKFFFEISMTVNARNCDQLVRFIDLGVRLGAEPVLLLVGNPFQTVDFQKEFLHFTDDQFAEMEAQIALGLDKVRAHGFKDAESALVRLTSMLATHRKGENNITTFRLKTFARRVFRLFPAFLQRGIRKILAS